MENARSTLISMNTPAHFYARSQGTRKGNAPTIYHRWYIVGAFPLRVPWLTAHALSYLLALSSLFRSQRLDRVHTGGTLGGIEAEDNADQRGDAERNQDRERIYH